MPIRESAFTWLFGAALSEGSKGSLNNRLGSTGAGAAFNTLGNGEQFTFMVETDGGATCSYQIRTGRTSSGPWAVLSSGTLSTGAVDVVQMPGPLKWLSPRLKTATSTAVNVIVRMEAI